MAKTVKKASASKKPASKKMPAKKNVSKTKKVASKAKKIAPKLQSIATGKNGVAATSTKKIIRPTSVTEKKSSSKGSPPVILTANDNDVIANAKVRYSTKDLNFFRTELLKQRDEAKEEFDIISQQLLDTTGEYEAENQSFALHTAEQGSDAMEREKQYLQAQRTSDFIKKLDEALERIDRGVYGICVVCGDLIEKDRLMAVPITQKHVSCKNKTQAKKFSVAGSDYGVVSEDAVE